MEGILVEREVWVGAGGALGWSASVGSQDATLGWFAGEGNWLVRWGAGAGRAAVFPAGT
jgi:hypothetical protein